MICNVVSYTLLKAIGKSIVKGITFTTTNLSDGCRMLLLHVGVPNVGVQRTAEMSKCVHFVCFSF